MIIGYPQVSGRRKRITAAKSLENYLGAEKFLIRVIHALRGASVGLWFRHRRAFSRLVLGRIVAIDHKFMIWAAVLRASTLVLGGAVEHRRKMSEERSERCGGCRENRQAELDIRP